MKPNIYLKIIFIFFIINPVFSQKSTISGKIKDKNTGENIIGANIVDAISGNNTTSNNYGFYSLSFNSGDSAFLQIYHYGYSTKIIKIKLQSDLKKDIELSEEIKIDEVIINADNLSFKKQTSGIINIPINQINNLPLIGAETDLIKAYQLMPGIQSGNEGSSGLYVRGGSPDQNLIILDDVPIYYINHLGGFVSIFNTDAIKNATLIKGSFPARYGGRLSSVLDVKMKDGNLFKKHYNYTIGTLTSKYFFETPIKQNKSSFIFSARGFLWGIIYRPISRIILKNVSLGYNFYDINSKFNQKINDKNRIYISIYAGNDNLKFKVKDKIINNSFKADYSLIWGNIISSFRWNKIFSNKIFSNLTISYTRYKYLSEINYADKEENTKINSEYSSGINDLSTKYDINCYLNKNITVNTGILAIHHTFNPGINYQFYNINDSILKDKATGSNKIISYEGAFYFENRIKISNIFDLNIGVRFDDYFINKKQFFSTEPRILFNFYITKQSGLKASYTDAKQNVHLLTSSTVGLPADIWVPATVNAQPEKAKQLSLSYFKFFPPDKFELSIETYYKTMQNLIAYKEGINYKAATASWEDKIEKGGKGCSYGIEFLFQKKTGNTTGWFAYTYSNTDRKFQNINNGIKFPYKYDRRHDISIVINRKISDNFNFSVSWVFGSGYPYTLPLNKYDVSNNNFAENENYETVFNWSEKNSFRMRTFHHLDASIFFNKKKKRGTRKFAFNIYNIYNRKNPYFYYLSDENGQWKLYQQSLFPVIPSISYSFAF